MSLLDSQIHDELIKLNETATEIKNVIQNQGFDDFSDPNGSFQTSLRDLSISLDRR